jgi:hypothetical protein
MLKINKESSEYSGILCFNMESWKKNYSTLKFWTCPGTTVVDLVSNVGIAAATAFPRLPTCGELLSHLRV